MTNGGLLELCRCQQCHSSDASEARDGMRDRRGREPLLTPLTDREKEMGEGGVGGTIVMNDPGN